jgi:hypothetical protein
MTRVALIAIVLAVLGGTLAQARSRAPSRSAAEAALTRRLLDRFPKYNAYFTDCRHRTRTRFHCRWRAEGRRRTRVVAGTARVVRRHHRWRVAIYPVCRNRPRCLRYGDS